MKLSDTGYKLIQGFEGLRLRPYYDVVGKATIGYGNTFYPNGKSVSIKDKEITKEYAIEIFKNVADKFAEIVDALVIVNINQNQFDALVSLCYNIGTENFKKSTLLKKINNYSHISIIEFEFKRWVYANGFKVKGLVYRRQKEFYIYSIVK